MKKAALFWFCLCANALSAVAQQLPQYSLFALNPFAYNPAAAGSEDALSGSALYRRQWVNLLGAPTTYHFNAHLPVYAIRSGLGLRVENDVVGAHRTTTGVLAWNYRIDLGRHTQLALGLGGGYMTYALDGAKLRAPEGVYVEPGAPTHNDPILPDAQVTAGSVLWEAGVYLQRKTLTLGFSSLPAFAPDLRFTSAGALQITPARHYTFMGIYGLALGQNLMLQPAFFAKTDLIAFQSEISALVFWQDNIFAGVSYRGTGRSSRDAAIFSAGMRLSERTKLAYAFDFPLSALGNATRGTHELMLRYSVNNPLGSGKLPPVIYNPRFY